MSNPTSPPTESGRFFAWLRGLGITRVDGWIGGVCGGIAARTGLDPLVVRGIAVVVAILGGPALFFYAAGWLLLPDTHGEIHLERMLRGIFDAPLIAIAVLVALTFVPFTQGAWSWGGHLAGLGWWFAAPAVALRVLWNLAIIAAIVWFVVWLVRRYRNAAPGSRPFAAPRAPEQEGWGGGAPGAAAGDGAGATAFPATASGTAVAASADADARQTAAYDAASAGAVPEPGATPSAPGAGASGDDLAEWRQKYAEWRAQHAAWQEQQRAASRSERDARSAEARARAQSYAAEAAERRRVRAAANPRAAGWMVALVLGAALVAGGIAGAISAADASLSRYAAPIGLAVALMVIGLGMVIAGIFRRRSGWLAALAIVTLVIGLGSFGWPPHSSAVGFMDLDASRGTSVSQFAGRVGITASASEVRGGPRTVRVDQTFGDVSVYLDAGVTASVHVRSAGSSIRPVVVGHDGEARTQPTIAVGAGSGAGAGSVARTVERSWSNAPSGSAQLIVDVTQGRGVVYVYDAGTAPTNSTNG